METRFAAWRFAGHVHAPNNTRSPGVSIMLSKFLRPQSIAVIGASQELTKIRGRMLRMLIDSGYAGRIFPINPSHREIQGIAAYPDVAALPEPADLALVATPAESVCAVLEDCAAAGILGAIVFTAGAVDGSAAEQQLVAGIADVVRRTGMRVLGPNCEGFLNVHDNVSANFSPSINHGLKREAGRPEQRPISIVAQSGAVGFGLYTRLQHQGLPVRYLVTTGNEAGLDCLDFVEHILREGGSGPILIFIEGFKDPRRFAAIAALAADQGTPLVISKAGNSVAGKRAAASHTAHMTGAATAYEAMFRRYGVVSVADSDQMMIAAAALAGLPLAQGKRVAVISTSGGTGVWLADVCSAHGLEFPVPDAALRARLAEVVPAIGGIANPIDMSARVIEGRGALLAAVLQVMHEAHFVDAVIVAMSLSAKDRIREMSPALEGFLKSSALPLIVHSTAHATEDNLAALAEIGGLCFSMPDSAYAIAVSSDYAAFLRQWRSGGEQRATVVDPALSPHACAELLARGDVAAVLRAYDIPMPPESLASSVADAVAAATSMAYPVAVKIASVDVPHKTDAGAVVLNVSDAAGVERAYSQVLANVGRAVPEARIAGMQIQKMMPAGIEMIVGITRDEDFGPLLMVGFGGVLIEVLRDVAFAPVPVSVDEAEDLIGSLKAFPVLKGLRGAPPVDVRALARLVHKVSCLAAEQADLIGQIDLNPVFVYPQGVCAVDYLVLGQTSASSAH